MQNAQPGTPTNRGNLEHFVGWGGYPPQTQQIAQHLLKVGNITSLEAGALYKSRSLTRRIADIRQSGVRVDSQRRKDATGQRYVRYVLA